MFFVPLFCCFNFWGFSVAPDLSCDDLEASYWLGLRRKNWPLVIRTLFRRSCTVIWMLKPICNNHSACLMVLLVVCRA